VLKRNKVCIHCGKEYVNKNYRKTRKYCSLKCYYTTDAYKERQSKGGKYRLGKTHTWGDKISQAKLGKPRSDMLGSKNPWWRGGVKVYRCLTSLKYKIWRRKVFKRDNYTCQHCGACNGNGKTVELNAHHILPWKLYPKKRYVISNGLTLCRKCHLKVHSKYGR